MANVPDANDRVGWELIWRGEYDGGRYAALAAPNASVVEWANSVPDGGFILDVGCGVGRHVIYLGGRGFRMAGMDIAPSGIKRSQEACAERQIAFDGKVSDMSHIPWIDATFDAVLSTSTMHHNRRADILQTLAEVRRVLKPGGLLLVDFPRTDTPGYQAVRAQVAAGELTEVEPNTFVDERPNLDDTNDAFLPHHFCDEVDVRDLLRSFEIVKLDAGESASSKRGRWDIWARKPLSG